MFSDIFKQLIQNKGVTVYQISKDTGISESLMSHWKSGRQLPKYDSLNILADYFNVSGDFLLGRTDEMPKQVEKQESQVVKEPTKSRIIPLYMTGASAGTGNWLSDDIPVEWMTIPKTSLTEQADFMLKVRGDSMQPKFFDNDVLLIKKSPSILEGEIGIFVLNGDSYVKQMGKGELISLNPVYEPIKLAEYDDIRCAGKVIGTVDFE
ncbi:MAG: LexA family transcriptional regulator [Ruminococcus sp.]|uniref:XRE family transcriptional regulator n=1 Tax=Ruminococcus sp. TaxID=41978 RepID=UPI0025E9BE51|nr:XRE family transcriptional regulator [Ruminococcus sp.]MBD9048931.1 LexA family transcriptional regulator [Ruminococcus sp.]